MNLVCLALDLEHLDVSLKDITWRYAKEIGAAVKKNFEGNGGLLDWEANLYCHPGVHLSSNTWDTWAFFWQDLQGKWSCVAYQAHSGE